MQPITGIPILDAILGLLDTWGYLFVVLFTISENIFLLGSMTPGETIVMGAAFLSVPGNGSLSLPVVWVCSVLGTVLGSNISYWIGRRGGRDFLVRHGRRFRITEDRIAATEAYFYRHGSKTVFLSRFAAGFKNFVPVIAGVSKMPILYFQGWTLFGAVTYTSAMCAIGYLVGDNFDRALAVAKGMGYVGFALFVGVVLLVFVGRRRLSVRRREALLDEYAEELADEYGVEALGIHLDRAGDDYSPGHDDEWGELP